MRADPRHQLLTMGLPGAALDAETRAFIGAAQPGGFILFARNLRDPGQVRALCDELRDLCEVPPIITIDQEGGRVSRLRVIGEEPPSADQLRRAGRVEWIAEHGTLTAELLRLFGFNLDLAPVADIALDPRADNSLMDRCYGLDPDEVVRNAGAFLDALQAGGVAGTVKHFPGYSRCEKDPHGALPRIWHTRAELEELELRVFRALLPRAAAAMVGHAVYPAFDADGVPSSLSANVVAGALREEMGFNGLVMTDDLEMGAIAGEYGVADAVRMAVGAGNDLLLFCHQRECVEMACSVLATMDHGQIGPALDRMRRFKDGMAEPSAWDAASFRRVNDGIASLRERVARAAAGSAPGNEPLAEG